MAVGDINGDGKADIIISAPNTNSNAGSVYVVYGASSFMPAATTINNLNTSLFTATVPANVGLMVGQAVEGGSIPMNTTITACGGSSTIGTLCGSAATITLSAKPTGNVVSPETLTVVSIPVSAGYGTLIDGTQGIRLDGATAGDYLGSGGLATGDVDGDGKADILIGAPQASYNAKSHSGSGYLVYGAVSPMLLPQATTVTTANLSTGITPTPYTGLMVGQTLTASGIPVNDTIASCNAGNVTTLGTVCTSNIKLTTAATGTSTTLTVASTPLVTGAGTLIDGTQGGVRFDGATASDYSGSSPAAGDIDGDGHADFVFLSNAGGGRDYVIFGNNSRSWSGSAVAFNTITDGTHGFQLYSALCCNAIGDVNSDGFIADIITTYDTGAIYFGHKTTTLGIPGPHTHYDLSGM